MFYVCCAIPPLAAQEKSGKHGATYVFAVFAGTLTSMCMPKVRLCSHVDHCIMLSCNDSPVPIGAGPLNSNAVPHRVRKVGKRPKRLFQQPL
jgi:hypothetical protein